MYIIIISFVELVVRHGHFGWPSWPSSKREVPGVLSGGTHHVMCTESWLPGVLSGGAQHVMCTGSWLPGVLSGGAHHVMCTGSWLHGVLSVYLWCVQEVDCLVCCQVVHTMWCVQEVDCMVCCQCTCDVYRKLLSGVLSGGAHQVVCTGRWLHGVLSVYLWCLQEADCMVCCQCACDVYRKLIAWCVVRWCTPCDVYRKWGHHSQPWNPALWLYPCVNSDQHSHIGEADFYTLCFIPRDCEELGLGGWYIAWDMYCYSGGIYSVCYQFETFFLF